MHLHLVKPPREFEPKPIEVNMILWLINWAGESKASLNVFSSDKGFRALCTWSPSHVHPFTEGALTALQLEGKGDSPWKALFCLAENMAVAVIK